MSLSQGCVGSVLRSAFRRSRRATGDGCPGCDGESARVHSRYRRQFADTAIGGHPVMIDLRVRPV
ncbi:transposase family protein [Rhodococcus sp. IEGM 1307]|uniref:transposase family protein n=1 Tax=Rhodococcus sp. IEGM 1307 TaxID=3047091 RepID=UPI0032D56991